MFAGRLYYPIEIWHYSTYTTEYGTSKAIYSDPYETRADVKYNTGNREIENDGIVSSVQRDFIVRHYVPVTQQDRIKFDNSYWQITSVDASRDYNNKYIKTYQVNE